MKIAIPILALLFLSTLFIRPAFCACPEFSNWSTSWTDSYGQTTYKLIAPCKVYLGVPFAINATVHDNTWTDTTVGWNWAIKDNGVVLASDDSIFGIWVDDSGNWSTSFEQTYFGTPLNHTFQFTFTDFGNGPGGMSWGGGILGGVTVDPYLITLASNFSFSTAQQGTATIPATVYVPTGSNPLTYSWLEGTTVIQSSQSVNGTGYVNIPLNIAAVSSFSAGSHTVTLQVTDGTLIGSKSTSVTITMPLPTIMGTPATSATAGVPYSFTPTATNAASFSISGTLPPGLGFNTTTGTLSGTPTTVGTYGNIIITDTDASGSASLPAFSITVAKGSPSITALPAASGINLGQALSNSSLTGGTGSVPGTFTFMTPSTVPSSAGTYSAGITFTPSDTTDYNSVSGSVNVAVASVTANGGCGTSNGVTFLVAPGANLCSTGTPTSVSGSGPWNWSCNGTGGGTTASCSAAMAAAPTTPVATATVPTVNFSGAIPGTTFTILRSAGGSTPVQIASGTSTTITDNSVLLPNTIYTYLVSSDTDPTQTTVMTIHTPMYNGWNIVAVPYQTTGVNPATFFGSPVSAVYQWIPSGATPESSNSVLGSYTTVSSLTPGYGYFVEASNSSTLLTYSGTAGPASATVTLKPGWTMIANPNTTNKTNIGTNWMIDGTALSSAIFAGTIGSSLYWWNGTTYDFWTVASNPQIEPWKAYWILNLDLVNHTLTIQ